MSEPINNLHDLGMALGLPENSGETLTNQAAGWLLQHGFGAVSGAEGLGLYPVGSFVKILLPWPITLDLLMEVVNGS